MCSQITQPGPPSGLAPLSLQTTAVAEILAMVLILDSAYARRMLAYAYANSS
jgi:hypothetical protein